MNTSIKVRLWVGRFDHFLKSVRSLSAHLWLLEFIIISILTAFLVIVVIWVNNAYAMMWGISTLMFSIALLRLLRQQKTTSVQKTAENTTTVELSSKVIHDIRSSLVPIMGYAELLTYSDLRQETSHLDTCQRVILSHGKQIDHLLNDLQLVTILQDSPSQPPNELIPIAGLAETLIREYHEQTGREIELQVQTQNELDQESQALEKQSPGIPDSKHKVPVYLALEGLSLQKSAGDICVQGSCLRLQDLLSQLIDNALKYSAPTQPVHVRILQEGSWVKVEVQDHGIGIAEADLGLLFRPFSRITNVQTAGIFGTGLGLFIVQQIAAMHQGWVEVQSQAGAGSTFTVFLPAY